MINYMYFPKYQTIEPHLNCIIEIFKNNINDITSNKYSLESNKVLEIIAKDLCNIGYQVEKSKKNPDKIKVPVLIGLNGKVEKSFDVDAYSITTKTVIEVEAGRAVTNHQFLKDFFEASIMQNVDFLCIAVRNEYRNSKDFKKVCDFFEAMYLSSKFSCPLKGLLIIGY